ncbi:MAG: hypothetical protein WBA23_15115 [Tunicatimonas sp.]|uniref:hypothetical protein n=1 Tax=Tunicatimonas sp. TaxID=1940096 RepID=UPI003C7903FE
MVNDNVVSVKLTAKEVEEAIQKIKEVQTKLAGKLIALTPEERQEIPKMSDRTQPFVEKVTGYVSSRPEFIPFYMSADELKIDVKAVNDLKQILREAEQLCQALNDTVMLSGSEAYKSSLAYYNSVKQAAKANVPNAEPVYDDLKKRFEKNRSTKSEE